MHCVCNPIKIKIFFFSTTVELVINKTENSSSLTSTETNLLNELFQLIEQTQLQISIQVNSSLTLQF